MKRFGILMVAAMFIFTGLISSCKKKERQPAPGGAERGMMEASPSPGGAERGKMEATTMPAPMGGPMTTAPSKK